MPALVQSLPDGPLDLIGDLHGEIDALLALLDRLGCDPDRCTVQRPLVFVGDLVDRGPDSPAVVEVVARLARAGVAFAIAGNHELNLLLGDKKEGSGWFYGDETDGWQPPGSGPARVPYDSRLATPAQREDFLAFFRELPLVLERSDLRVVHACWRDEAVRALHGWTDLAEVARHHSARLRTSWHESGLLDQAQQERAAFADLRRRDVEPDRPLPAHVAVEVQSQSEHPVKVLTSGLEHAIPFERRFFVGGRWRLVERTRWWETYDDAPAVVIGHYWRIRGRGVTGKPDFFGQPPDAWLGPTGKVFCIDYSVGRRYAERHAGRTDGFDHGLAALRWPERTLVFDDRDEPVPTRGFGQGPSHGQA